jgi:hypothetical protein
MPCTDATWPSAPLPEPHVGDGRPITPALSPIPSNPEPVPIPGLSKCVGTSGFCEAQAEEAKKRFPSAPVKMEIPSPLQGTVTVLWESATPVRAAKEKLGIADTSNRPAAGCYVVSVIGYPMQSAIGEALNASQPLPVGIKQLIQQSAVLIPKGRQPIIASDVEIGGSENAMNVRFFLRPTTL